MSKRNSKSNSPPAAANQQQANQEGGSGSSGNSDYSCINPKGRDELVGKRFLLVSSTSAKLKLSRISDWNWKAGVIRCASHIDIKDPELQV